MKAREELRRLTMRGMEAEVLNLRGRGLALAGDEDAAAAEVEEVRAALLELRGALMGWEAVVEEVLGYFVATDRTDKKEEGRG
jgi:hypothetical protein